MCPVIYTMCKLLWRIIKSQVLKIWDNYIRQWYDQPNQPENQEVEPEEEVHADEKGHFTLWSEVEKPIKEVRN
jgi:hypothetical protein